MTVSFSVLLLLNWSALESKAQSVFGVVFVKVFLFFEKCLTSK